MVTVIVGVSIRASFRTWGSVRVRVGVRFEVMFGKELWLEYMKPNPNTNPNPNPNPNPTQS